MGLIPATLSLLLSIAAASPLSRPYDAPVTKYLISFGDSYSQTGFNLSRGVPSTSNILGFPTLPGWTSSKGNNWVTYLATEFNSSLLLSYNFASGGATTDAAIVAGYKPYPEVLSFINQVDQFTEYAKQGTGILGNKELLQKDALFAVWMGVNDVGNSYWQGNVSDVITAIMTQRTKLMSTLYDGGARQFVLLSVPPLYLTPTMLSQEAASRDTEKTIIGKYNDGLAAAANEFIASHNGSSIKIVDTTSPFNKVISSPQEFGAANATCYDQQPGNSGCLWNDAYHPTTAIHREVARSVAQAVGQPYFK